ncbi:uncharacterized protein LOC100367807 [Saccoglossus kowalevskii]|uniref:Tumor necrosis factor receptor superfamily member 6-like n=1 Tax=Saccoglossus kowalevskii TaxID=10224 RepID=A0ABM0GKF0_SACKO|nr:PREDICTED: tumor necrosis factor receptor superfamily member 6-like [Saccoglossus kowalevskii]
MASYNKLAVDSPIKKAVAVTLVILFFVDTTAALCKTNSYAVNIKGEIQCEKCRKCPPGSYVSRVCGDYDNTECAQCDDGSYSTGWSRLGECKPCTRCPAHLATTRNCTKTQNAKCGKVCDHGYYSNILTAECEPCSWCLSTDENILQTRVPECVTQNMPRRFQCRHDNTVEGCSNLYRLEQ